MMDEFTKRRRAQLLAEGRTPTVLTDVEKAVMLLHQEAVDCNIVAAEEAAQPDGTYPCLVAKIKRQLNRLS